MRVLLQAAPEAALAQDVFGRLPLHCAARASENEEAVRVLLEAAPAAALVADKEGRLPLHWAAMWGDIKAVLLGSRLAVSLGLASWRAKDGSFSFCCSATGGTAAAVRLLLEAAPQAARTTARSNYSRWARRLSGPACR